MKKCLFSYYLVFILLINLCSCQSGNMSKTATEKIRPLKDTIGFAQYSWQMDSLMARMSNTGWEKSAGFPWKFAICPHDDYTYVGKLYPELLQNIKAPNLILIGVAHKAAQLKIEDSMVFDSYTYWKGPWKKIAVSPVRGRNHSQFGRKICNY